MFTGDSTLNIPGLFDNADIPEDQAVAAVGGGNSRVWGVDKTPDEVIADITGLVSTIVSTYDGAFADLGKDKFTIILPASEMLYIQDTPRSTQSDMSIESWILQNSNLIEGFELVHEAKNQGNGGGAVMLAYIKDPDIIEAHVSDQIIWQAPQFHGLDIQVPGEMEFGGVENRYPLTFRKLYGI